jgi:hypothetical protein
VAAKIGVEVDLNSGRKQTLKLAVFALRNTIEQIRYCN